eukprot:GEMP01058452.1.p1 GENE.GEMP01058452.1~~GEMP01058452.1.p1  ORF type:complete len:207 (+),score=22.39 GEMP01058452.1:320-940(+)
MPRFTRDLTPVTAEERARKILAKKVKLMSTILLVPCIIFSGLLFRLFVALWHSWAIHGEDHAGGKELFVVGLTLLACICTCFILAAGIIVSKSRRAASVRKYRNGLRMCTYAATGFVCLQIYHYINFKSLKCSPDTGDCSQNGGYRDDVRGALLWSAIFTMTWTSLVLMLRSYSYKLECLLAMYFRDPFDGTQLAVATIQPLRSQS